MFGKKAKQPVVKSMNASKQGADEQMLYRLGVMCKFNGRDANTRYFSYLGKLHIETDPDNPEFPFYYQYKLLKEEQGNLSPNYFKQLFLLQEMADRQNFPMEKLLEHARNSTQGRICKLRSPSNPDNIARIKREQREKLDKWHADQTAQKQQDLAKVIEEAKNKVSTEEVIKQIKEQGAGSTNGTSEADVIKANIQDILAQGKSSGANATMTEEEATKLSIQKILATKQKSNETADKNPVETAETNQEIVQENIKQILNNTTAESVTAQAAPSDQGAIQENIKQILATAKQLKNKIQTEDADKSATTVATTANDFAQAETLDQAAVQENIKQILATKQAGNIDTQSPTKDSASTDQMTEADIINQVTEMLWAEKKAARQHKSESKDTK